MAEPGMTLFLHGLAVGFLFAGACGLLWLAWRIAWNQWTNL